jgi:hypothetical protein
VLNREAADEFAEVDDIANFGRWTGRQGSTLPLSAPCRAFLRVITTT